MVEPFPPYALCENEHYINFTMNYKWSSSDANNIHCTMYILEEKKVFVDQPRKNDEWISHLCELQDIKAWYSRCYPFFGQLVQWTVVPFKFILLNLNSINCGKIVISDACKYRNQLTAVIVGAVFNLISIGCNNLLTNQFD